jgi:hypothetical protein
MNRPKYRNKKAGAFDSKAEARRIGELRLLEAAGEIRDLHTQVKFLLIPSQRIGGKVVERPVTYTADATYRNKAGQLIVEDVKSKASKTQQYVIRRKLMLWVHGIQILETK